MSADGEPVIEARTWLVTGQVQGVGFRPFVYRVAHAIGIQGYVRNRLGQVEILGEGTPGALDRFGRALAAQAPRIALPEVAAVAPAKVRGRTTFRILPSISPDGADIHVPPDYGCCDDCLDELNDPADRRHRYPFINCTQCGPRYTLIARLPYDRDNTSMASFVLCPACRREYEDPADRRFHAEPAACAACGPSLWYREAGRTDVTDTQDALAACVAALRAGRIVAVKGIGGYHLMADGCNDAAVSRLRLRKGRPHKPLAVMFPADHSLRALHAQVRIDATTAAALTSAARPIVLAPLRAGSPLAASLAPGLNEVGVMLPYSPLHHLLLADFGGPLVATSGNVSGEPVLTDNAEVGQRLQHVADACLHHNRPVVRPADDAVWRVIAGQARPLRLGRGGAPLELVLPFALDAPLLAVGGHGKNTVALAWGRRAVISPHIGELASPRAREIFCATIRDLQSLYGVRAQTVVCDAHPGHGSTRWALASGLPVVKIFHHAAHAAALAGEYPQVERWLVFAWDGVGYGEDGTLWGGEALLGTPGTWRRAGTLRPFHLPGGERAGREPWRSAAALGWESGGNWPRLPSMAQGSLLHEAWVKRVNTPQTSAAGRLFDAAAALLGLLDAASFEGQGPMWLEAVAGPAVAQVLPLERNAQGVWQTDWAPLVPMLLDGQLTPARRAGIFHASMARALVDQACAVREQEGEFTVGLGGGVFQNRLLTETVFAQLQARGFAVRMGARVPCNDAGLSFGQVVEAAARRAP
jgi:hydrogenase maturation protein HypF